MRKLVLVSIVFGSLLAASSAQAANPAPLGLTCVTAGDGVRECGTGTSSTSNRSTAPSWDGTPIDVNVALPATGTGNFPLIIYGHGYGGEKLPFGASGTEGGMRQFTSRGYAVFSMTTRGFHESCGTDQAIAAAPPGACDNGFVHLMDDRFEVRDAQFLAGQLADEGWVNGQKVGAVGGSYGGGLSLALASLKDRVMMPDGHLVPWTSPVDGIPMQIAGAAPIVPWSDLSYSLTPNGGTLDYVADSPYTGRIGIEKASLVAGLYISGNGAGKYCGEPPYPTPCNDPEADLTDWNARLAAGEPYDGDPAITSIFNEITAHHSAYYIDHSVQPAPLLIANGFTDDLFPADEAIRFYNRIRSLYPAAPVSLFFGDFGHPRAKEVGDAAPLSDATGAWLDYYVKGAGSEPFQGTTAFAMTCPVDEPSGGPFKAGSWAGLQNGEVRLVDAGSKTIAPDGGSASVDATWNPVVAGQNPCTSANADDLPGVATYRLPAAAGGGYTVMGSPTVVARISSPTANSELAARLLDVGPDGKETLIDRQLFRPAVGTARQVFQLHPTGHHVAPGHVAKLELLPKDAGGLLGGYGRAANGQGEVTISDLDLRIPVLDGPGAAGGQVSAALPKPLPCGSAIAPQFSSVPYLRASLGAGKVKARRKRVLVPVDSAPGANPCLVKVQLFGSGRGKGKGKGKGKAGSSAKKHKKKKNVLGRGTATIAGGQSATVKVKLSKHGRAAVKRGRGLRVRVLTVDPAGNTLQISKIKVKHKKHKAKGKKHSSR